MKKILRPLAIILSVVLIVSSASDFFGTSKDIWGYERETEETVQKETEEELTTEETESETETETETEVEKETESESETEMEIWADENDELPVFGVSGNDDLINYGAIDDKGDANFPDNLTELEATGQTIFYIKTYQDWINLGKLSKVSSLAGYEFVINKNLTPNISDTSLYDLSQLTDAEFSGIGTEDFPFMGKLRCSSTNDTSLICRKPLFACLGGSAKVHNILIKCTTGVAGLAAKLKGSGTLELMNIFIHGNLSGSNTSAVGGLFAEIENTGDEPLRFNIIKETGASQNGIALGVTGTDTNNTTSLSIYGAYCGSIAGKVTGNVILEYDDSLISIKNTTIRGNRADGSNGYIFGIMEGTGTHIPTFTLAKDSVIRPLFDGSSYGSSGGVIGYVNNGIIDTAGHILTVESSHKDSSGNWGTGTVDIYGNLGTNAGGVGGIAGVLKNSTITDDSTFCVQNINMATNGSSNAEGGVFGYVLDSNLGTTTMDGKGYIIENIKLSSSTNAAKNAGGIIGLYESTGDIENTISYCKVYNSYIQSKNGPAGAIIGHIILNGNANLYVKDIWEVAGCVITAATSTTDKAGTAVIGRVDSSASSQALFRIADGTYQRDYKRDENGNYRAIYLGGYLRMWDDNCEVAGIVGAAVNVNIEIDDIIIDGLELSSKSYCGGVIAKIDNPDTDCRKYAYIRDITIKGNVALPNSTTNPAIGFIAAYVGQNVALALDGTIDISSSTWTNRSASYYGQIAGINMGSLIFLEAGATFNKYENTSTSYLRDVDEVGNYGGMFQNGKWDGADGELLFKSKDANPVNGTVAMDGTAYNIATVGDMLRLAVAFNTEGNYGLEAFGEGKTYADLLKAEYHLTNTVYDMRATGLVAMQRNRGSGSNLTNSAAYFTGTFMGTASEYSKIIHEVTLYRQPYFGFFIYVGSTDTTTVFERLHMDVSLRQDSQNNRTGYITVAYMGGLATFAVGNINVKDCITDTDMYTCFYTTNTGINYANDARGYEGGLFGRYKNDSKSTKLNIENVYATGNKQIYDKDNYTAQLIGYVEIGSASPVAEINLNDITISGSVVFEKANEYIESVGGLIAVVNNGTRNMWQSVSSTTERMKINVDGLTFEGFNLSSNTVSSKSSGIIGYAWTDMYATFKNVTVKADSEGNATTLKTDRYFGGFITEAAGRIDMENINISNFNITETNGGTYHSGLLIGEGTVLYLSIKDYLIDGNTTLISGVNKSTFDEIVGISKSGSTSNTYGGVVSISSSDADKNIVTGDNYKRYVNQAGYVGFTAAELSNSTTRYYYDIPEILETAKTNNGGIVLADGKISSPEELMDWHLINYANNSIKSYFVLDTGKSYNNLIGADYIISGTIDLNGYSYYPTNLRGRTITGENNATIVFYAQDINNCEDNEYGTTGKKETINSGRQHYLMHSGLFYDITTSNVSNLTLTGTVSKHDSGSGGLCVGTVYGTTNRSQADIDMGYKYSTTAKTVFENITLDNLWVAGTSNMNGYYGLMIRAINAGAKVEFNKIRMINYADAHTTTASNKAAAALIGLVGSSDGVTNSNTIEINVKFTNMDIADVADTTDLSANTPDLHNSTEADKVLAWASFIYQYRYYEDTCWGLYTFYQADYLKGKGIDVSADSEGYITMGYEIGETVEFYDNTLITPIYNFPDNSTVGVNDYGFDYADYKPYVYKPENTKDREIYVNPKPGDITEGCGTYEDPYVIENVRQMTSLYYYLKNNLGVIQNWKVNKIGDDTAFCENSHIIRTISVDSDFPTRSEMNQAYYLINNDIDLSEFEEFIGFGSQTEPFIGVFVGNTAGGKNPVIKLPNQSVNNAELDSFAFIKYAKGCVVKDIDIQLGSTKTAVQQTSLTSLFSLLRSFLSNYAAGDDDDTYVYDYIKVKNAGAGVIAYILGGDNIIDNVTVKGKLKLGKNMTNANVGGYVGQLRLGTLIIRNLPSDGLKEFGVDYNNNANCLWIGGIIGNVKDGTAFYEGYSEDTFAVFDDDTNISNIYSNDSSLPATPNYSLINSSYIGSLGKIAVSSDASGLKLKVSNDAQLMMIAAALTNGTLTYEARDEVKAGYALGYNPESRCRNGNYDKVGNTSESDAAYTDVIKNDNLNGGQDNGAAFFAPYILNYFESFDMSIIFPDVTVANFKSSYIDMNANMFTLELGAAEGVIVTYDMAAYKKAFRGIGSLYNRTNNYFKGNIDGKDSIINMDYAAYDAIPATNIGLLNYVKISKQTDYCYVKDITLKGTVVNTNNSVHTYESMNDISGNSVSEKNAAGLMGMLVLGNSLSDSFTGPYNYYFDNVDIDNLKVGSLENSGGIIARVSGDNTALGFNNCDINKLNTRSLADAAGMVASFQDAIDLRFDNCSVTDSELKALGMYYLYLYNRYTYLYPSTAGFAGRAVAKGKNIIIEGGNVNNLTLHSTGHSGGLIGQTEGTIKINESGNSTTTINDVNMRGLGVIGKQQIGGNSNSTSYVELTAVSGSTVDYRSRYLGSFGGCVGFAGQPMTAKNITITNPDIEIPVGISTDNLNSGNSLNTNSYYPQTFIGGIVGIMDNGGTIEDCTVGSTDGTIRLIGDSQYTVADENGIDTYDSARAKEQADISNKKYNRVGVGGFVGSACNGRSTNTNSVLFNNCHLIGDTAVTSNISGYIAGGYIGTIRNTTNNTGILFNYQNCTVDRINIGGLTRAAGFVSDAQGALTQQFNNSHVSNCNIKAYDIFPNSSSICSAGFLAEANTFNRVYNCSVNGCTIGGTYSYYTGGFGAKLPVSYGMINCVNSTVENNTLMGLYVGGIAGFAGRNSGGACLLDNTEIINNRIIGFYQTDTQIIYVGGAYGYGSTSSNYLYGNNITIKNNLIAGVHLSSGNYTKTRVGGFAGYYNDRMYIDNINLEDNIIGMLDNDKFTEELDTILKKEEYIITNANYDIWDESGNIKADKIDDNIGIFAYPNNTLDIVPYPDKINEGDLYKYASYIGLFTGINSTNPASVTNFNVTYTGLEKYRPAVDVGYNGKANGNSNIYGYRQYYHIVYPDTYFEDIEQIIADYNNAGNFATINYRLQFNYTSSGTMDSFDTVLKNTYKDDNGYLSPFKDVDGNPIKMAVYDNTDLDKVINSYINLITNNGGAISYNGTQGGIIKVSAYKMRVTDGVAVRSDSETPSIKVSNGNAGQNSVTLTVNNLGYDTITDDKNGTYTILHIEYGWTNTSSYKTFQYGLDAADTYTSAAMTPYAIEIPIFVKKMLEIDTHIIGLSGSQYDIDKILTEGSAEMSILKGIYTAYIEYNYNDAVQDYTDKLQKELYFLTKDGTSYVPVFENTKLTLVDLDTGKVYYYKSPYNITGSVKLSEFKDIDGNPYTEPNLNSLDLLSGDDKKGSLYYKHYNSEVAVSGKAYDDNEEVAMQKYLLLMDTSEVSVSRENSYAYTVNLKPIEDGVTNSFLKKCRYPIDPECTLKITEILGIKGNFLGETSVTGEVSEDSLSGLSVNIEYEITASQSYWDYKNSSSDILTEYLDVAFYLIKNGVRTPLPSGTLVTFDKGTAEVFTTSTTGETILYFYKDSLREKTTDLIRGDSEFSGTINFDFSHADFSEFEEGTYTVRMELLKTTEKEFPMGGESLDIYNSEFTTRTERNLGFVLEAEDLMALGMNGYLPETSDLGNVKYKANIDFTEYIPKSDNSNKDDFEAMAQKYFTIKYSILRKVKNSDDTYSYIPYTGDDIKVYYDGIEISEESGVTFRLSEEMLISGNRGKNDHVFEIPFELKANVDNLLTSNVNITNYRVVGQLFISDSALDGETALGNNSDIVIIDIDESLQPDVSLNDFFIFTVAKIKKDLNIK